MNEKECQYDRIFEKTIGFGRPQLVREIQIQINDNNKKDKEIERLNNIIDELEKKMDINFVIKNEDLSGKQIIDTKQTEGAILFRDYLKQELKELKEGK